MNALSKHIDALRAIAVDLQKDGLSQEAKVVTSGVATLKGLHEERYNANCQLADDLDDQSVKVNDAKNRGLDIVPLV